MSWRIIEGDCVEAMRQMEPESAQTCITSPPYWGLRDYGVDGQIGLEDTPDEYVARMVEVFREVHRVLRDDGTLWLNLGDSYAGSWGAQSRPNANDKGSTLASASMLSARQIAAHPRGETGTGSLKKTPGLKNKDLVGIPWRVAFALQANGWYLRRDIIWDKPNAMPESVTDRPSSAHEYLFLLSKQERYYYDHKAVRTPAKTYRDALIEVGAPQEILDAEAVVQARKTDKQRGHGRRHAGFNDRWDAMSKAEQQAQGANLRSVWHVATSPYAGAHFATFPPKLILPCVRAGSAQGDTVLDPFNGAGTTGMVALREGRSYVGVELNPEYVQMARARIIGDAPLFNADLEASA